MPDIYLNLLPFVAVPPAVPTSLPHLINVRGEPTLPDRVEVNNGDFTVTATVTDVTVLNTSGIVQSVDVWCELKHSIDRAFPPGFTGAGLPFTPDGGGSGGGNTIVTPVIVAGGTTALCGETVRVDPTGAPFTLDLEPITPANAGCLIEVVNVSGSINTVTLDADGVQTINGVGTFAFSQAFSSVSLRSDGVSNWMIV